MYSGVLIQFVIAVPDHDEPQGLAVAYRADLHNRTAYLAVVVKPERIHTGMGMEAMILFVNYLLTTWDFRKLYIEAIEYNYRSFATLGESGLFTVEGRLKDDHYYAGRYWDQLFLAVYRDDAARFLTSHLPRVVAKAVAG
jgi:RimJ/RimL family protein N-acetyltransferase